MAFDRYPLIEGVFNLRDVGQYEARDGRAVQPRRLFRCGALHRVSAAAPLGIRTVLDLRSESEIDRDAVACGPLLESPNIRRISIPLIPETVGQQGVRAHLDALAGPGITVERYSQYLKIGAANICRAIEALAEPGAFPALIHCTAGKDRTGVLIALLLDLIGVPRSTIVEDYALSNDSRASLIQHLRSAGLLKKPPTESDMALYSAPPEALDGLLERLHNESGSARDYLALHGMKTSVFTAIEAGLLDP